jgi:sorbose reductase
VCNAGVNKVADFLEMSWDAHRRLFEVNVLGVYHTAQMAASLMVRSKAAGPSIILIGSIAGRNSVKTSNHSAYSGTKGAVLGLLPAIAKELGPLVRISLLSRVGLMTSITCARRRTSCR